MAPQILRFERIFNAWRTFIALFDIPANQLHCNLSVTINKIVRNWSEKIVREIRSIFYELRKIVIIVSNIAAI